MQVVRLSSSGDRELLSDCCMSQTPSLVPLGAGRQSSLSDRRRRLKRGKQTACSDGSSRADESKAQCPSVQT